LTAELFLLARLFYLKPAPAGLRARACPQARAKQLLLTAPPNLPKIAANLCQRDEFLLLKEIFGIIKLGAKFTMALTRPEGAEVAQPDKASAF